MEILGINIIWKLLELKKLELLYSILFIKKFGFNKNAFIILKLL